MSCDSAGRRAANKQENGTGVECTGDENSTVDVRGKCREDRMVKSMDTGAEYTGAR